MGLSAEMIMRDFLVFGALEGHRSGVVTDDNAALGVKAAVFAGIYNCLKVASSVGGKEA
jgi:hypothetical protein